MIAKIITARKGDANGRFNKLGQYVLGLEGKKLEDVKIAETDRIGEYVIDAAGGGEKVEWCRVTNCGDVEPMQAIEKIKATQALNTRGSNKTMHMVVSFPEGEKPTLDQLRDIEDFLVASLGLQDHQRISALHVDTDNVHLHIALNRVHPVSLRCVDPFQGQRKLMEACEYLEIKHNLERTNHGLTPDEQSQAIIQGKAADMEAHTGEKSFMGWLKEVARDELLAAKATGSWEAVHAVAEKFGVEIQQRGAGLVIVDTKNWKLAVKASSVDRELSIKQLTDALGAFVPSAAQRARMEQEVNEAGADRVHDPDGAGAQRDGRAGEGYDKGPRHRHPSSKSLYEIYREENGKILDARTAALESTRKRYKAFHDELNAWFKQSRSNLFDRSVLAALERDKRGALKDITATRNSRREKARAEEQEAVQEIRGRFNAPSWQQWLQARAEAGDAEALAVLRSKEQSRTRFRDALGNVMSADEMRDTVLKHRRVKVSKNGVATYSLPDGSQVRDYSKYIYVSSASAASTVVAVELAAEKFTGKPLKVSGSPAFKEWVVRQAATSGADVKFEDPALEALRVRQQATKAQDHSQSRPGADRGRPEETGRGFQEGRYSLHYQDWKPDLSGEFVFMGAGKARNGADAFLWQQGDKTYAQPATDETRREAADLTNGDRVTFVQGKAQPIDRDTGFTR